MVKIISSLEEYKAAISQVWAFEMLHFKKYEMVRYFDV